VTPHGSGSDLPSNRRSFAVWFFMRQSVAAFKHIIGAKRQKFSHQLKKSAINCHSMGKLLPL